MELTSWMQMLALSGTDSRRWEPQRLRLRLLWIDGKLARTSRQIWMSLSKDAPWVAMVTACPQRLQPDQHRPDLREWSHPDDDAPPRRQWNPPPNPSTRV